MHIALPLAGTAQQNAADRLLLYDDHSRFLAAAASGQQPAQCKRAKRGGGGNNLPTNLTASKNAAVDVDVQPACKQRGVLPSAEDTPKHDGVCGRQSDDHRAIHASRRGVNMRPNNGSQQIGIVNLQSISERGGVHNEHPGAAACGNASGNFLVSAQGKLKVWA